MKKLKVGLLPLYIELYDKVIPGILPELEHFYHTITSELTRRAVDVVEAEVCRLQTHFSNAVLRFEREEVDAIVTLHLAYSPSLESAEVLDASRLPVVVLNTTPDFQVGPEQDPELLLYNHGIHGVQDLCSVLLRKRKRFQIETGHWQKSDVLDRVVERVRASRLASSMRSARVGLVGKPFAGMGDFALPAPVLAETIGIQVEELEAFRLASLLNDVSEKSIQDEVAFDKSQFCCDGLDGEIHRCAAQAALVLRRWLQNEGLTAFTMNFLDIDESARLPTVPFLEASKAMARGLGYAGEGDVLTAAFVGALASVYPDTTFTEMFCPNWSDNNVLLSHMGEVNLRILTDIPRLKSCQFPFRRVITPVIAVGRYRPGQAVLLNLAPRADGSFSLCVAPVEVLAVHGTDCWSESIHGWIHAALPVAEFLSDYSRAGGTHHLAMTYGCSVREISAWGELMGWKLKLIE